MTGPVHIFISYAREDREHRETFERHLAPLREQKLIESTWSDDQIPPGDVWEEAIDKALGKSTIFIYLLSSHSIHPESWCRKELRRAEEQGRRVIPIRVCSCAFEGTGVERYQMLPTEGEPIAEQASQDAAWTHVVDELKDLLKSRRMSSLRKRQVSTAEYLGLQGSAREAVDRINVLATQLGWKSVTARVEAIKNALRQDPYRVVITGKSRAGKSTLMNALVGRTLCPVDRMLTTAAPTIIGPGDPEKLTITFDSGKQQTIERRITDEDLKPFVTQERNPKNEKKVSELRIDLADDNCLALGVEYADIPGLDDRHADISERAQAIVDRAHAWVLVIDVSPAVHGSFTIDRDTVELKQKAGDRPLFIVANKEDPLDEETKARVGAEIENVLGAKAFFMSAKFAIGAHTPAFGVFYDALWDALWKKEENGLRRLVGVFEELRIASEEAATLIWARDNDKYARRALEHALEACTREKRSIQNDCPKIVNAIRARQPRHLSTAGAAVSHELDAYLAQYAYQPLPRVSQAINQLIPRVRPHYQSAIDAFFRDVQQQSAVLGRRVAQSLAQLRAQVVLPSSLNPLRESLLGDEWHKYVSLPDLSDTGLGTEKVVTGGLAAVASGKLLMALGATFWPAAIAGGLAYFAISKIVEHAHDHVDSPQELRKKIYAHFNERMAELQQRYEGALATIDAARVEAVMGPFLGDMHARLEEIRELTEEEREHYAKLTTEVEKSSALLQRTFKT